MGEQGDVMVVFFAWFASGVLIGRPLGCWFPGHVVDLVVVFLEVGVHLAVRRLRFLGDFQYCRLA